MVVAGGTGLKIYPLIVPVKNQSLIGTFNVEIDPALLRERDGRKPLGLKFRHVAIHTDQPCQFRHGGCQASIRRHRQKPPALSVIKRKFSGDQKAGAARRQEILAGGLGIDFLVRKQDRIAEIDTDFGELKGIDVNIRVTPLFGRIDHGDDSFRILNQ